MHRRLWSPDLCNHVVIFKSKHSTSPATKTPIKKALKPSKIKKFIDFFEMKDKVTDSVNMVQKKVFKSVLKTPPKITLNFTTPPLTDPPSVQHNHQMSCQAEPKRNQTSCDNQPMGGPDGDHMTDDMPNGPTSVDHGECKQKCQKGGHLWK
jgi:hypothetical protein